MSKWSWILAVLCIANWGLADDVAPSPSTEPSTQPAGGVPNVQIDIKNKLIRVECQAVDVKAPLEFFCVLRGGPEHETVLRTEVRPSRIHFGLLALGLVPGDPAHYVQATNTWYPPTGPGLKIDCEFERNGVLSHVPAYRMMRSVKTHAEMPPVTWVFDGSRVMPDGVYAADITGYVVSIVNFDLTMIDVPELASNANETLEWECNPDICPPKGSKVTMIIAPAGPGAATQPAQGVPGGQFNPGPGLNGGHWTPAGH
jgi:hypothetical protein